MSKIVTIDGIEYIEIADTELPFGNVCRRCAFHNTHCYDRDNFTCHADERPDGIGIIFILANQPLDAEAQKDAARLKSKAAVQRVSKGLYADPKAIQV